MTLIYDSVWDALEDDLVKPDDLKQHAQLSFEIESKIKTAKISTSVLKEKLNISKNEAYYLANGVTDLFEIETLTQYLILLE